MAKAQNNECALDLLQFNQSQRKIGTTCEDGIGKRDFLCHLLRISIVVQARPTLALAQIIDASVTSNLEDPGPGRRLPPKSFERGKGAGEDLLR